ncbi:DUF488 domain-containing protein [Fundidesulfovibrio agrisoli]|uniref:DUF488 domain-containing protein n=1 Tax=Fundidesulfovibrio agrisoli TaxID=2922717 RepID=UPI001FAB7EB0|nr:DUF488 family protein [Fundidesulfovibrio agrisoli]
MLFIKRVYDEPSPEDGKRYLVDRLWPRGIAKEALRLDGWLKDLAPSNALRTWLHQDPARWGEFAPRYERELAAPDAAALAARIAAEAREGAVTLLYAARDRERNHALVLKEYLERLGAGA